MTYLEKKALEQLRIKIQSCAGDLDDILSDPQADTRFTAEHCLEQLKEANEWLIALSE